MAAMSDPASFLPAVLGGLLIGLSAGALALLNGRIAGISGILGGLLQAGASDRAWRAAFVAGLVMAPLAQVLLAPVLSSHVPRNLPLLAAAGLLVGFGTRLGGGCTSGHGVCGLARRSPRSLAATLVFMGVAAVTVFVTRHLLGG